MSGVGVPAYGPPVYTPTTEEVRDGYWINDGGVSDPEDAKRFNRWLAEHDRQVLETVLGPLRHILSSGYGCADCAYEDLREVARMEGLTVHCEHI